MLCSRCFGHSPNRGRLREDFAISRTLLGWRLTQWRTQTPSSQLEEFLLLSADGIFLPQNLPSLCGHKKKARRPSVLSARREPVRILLALTGDCGWTHLMAPPRENAKNFMPDAMGFDQRFDLHQTLRRFLRGSGDRSEDSCGSPGRLREFRFRPLPGNLSTPSVRQSRKPRAARSKIFSEPSESAKVRPLHWEPSRNTKRFRRSLAWSQVSELVLQILFNASGVVTRGVFFMGAGAPAFRPAFPPIPADAPHQPRAFPVARPGAWALHCRRQTFDAALTPPPCTRPFSRSSSRCS